MSQNRLYRVLGFRIEGFQGLVYLGIDGLGRWLQNGMGREGSLPYMKVFLTLNPEP